MSHSYFMRRRAPETHDACRKIAIAPTMHLGAFYFPILPVLGDNPRHDGP